MGTVLTHPFLCLNRYKQNDKTAYVVCCHSAAYSFTNKPEIGGGRLTRPDTANVLASIFAELIYCIFIPLIALAVVAGMKKIYNSSYAFIRLFTARFCAKIPLVME